MLSPTCQRRAVLYPAILALVILGTGFLAPNNCASAASSGVNVALAANGGVATASSTFTGSYPASAVNDGDRKGVNWGSGGGWNDATGNAYPDWVQIDFAATQTINEIDLFTIQDNYASPATPTLSMQFSKYGVSDFHVQYWTGSVWADVPGGNVIGNRNVWRQFLFGNITTKSIRVLINNGLGGYSRLVEIEAYQVSPVNVALAANGGVATASSTFSGSYPASAVNDGDRKGVNWGSGGGWNDATGNTYPDWVQINFSATQTINEIDLFTIQDNYASPAIPTLSMQFSKYGISDFQVQYWTGSAWANVPGGVVTGNRNVWCQFVFSNIATQAIRVLVNNALGSYSRIVEIEAYQRINVALAANGGVATASSTFSGGYPASAVNDGDRKGVNWGSGGGWNDATGNAYPDWVQIDFAATQTINEIDVLTIQDNYSAPSDPTSTMQFSKYGITDFQVQYWTGSAWTNVPGGVVTGNRNVWRQFVFGSITTSSIRVSVNNALGGYSRIAEIEAYQAGSTPSGPQIWIALRTDGLTGSGTQADPYDGSTPAKFDSVLKSYSGTPNLTINLGSGTFRSSTTHNWTIQAGWVISGAGMYNTTVQATGSVAGMRGFTVMVSDSNVATDNITLQDFTIDCNWAELSATAPRLNGEYNITVTAVALFGSNNLLERVRCINSYGSAANKLEHFAMYLGGSRLGDCTNNIIENCRAESPQGTYGNPFALAGWTFTTPKYLLTNSKVRWCTAVGIKNGGEAGFTSGGANLANVKDIEVDSNTFTDCFGAAYLDAGSVDGLKVTNNTVTRGWQGVGLANPALPKQNITITGNNFNIQNRNPDGASCGIVNGFSTVTNITVDSNTVSFDTSGTGKLQFWGIMLPQCATATISNNTVGVPPPSFDYGSNATGTGLSMFNNRTPDGTLIPTLNNQ